MTTITSMDPASAMNWAKTNHPNLTEQQIMNKLESEFGKPADMNSQATRPVVTEQKLEELFGASESNGNTATAQPSDFLFDSATDENSLIDIDGIVDLDDTEEFSYSSEGVTEPANAEANKEEAVKALADLADISEADAKDILSGLNIDKGSEKVDPNVTAQKLANAAEIEVEDAISFLKEYVGDPQK